MTRKELTAKLNEATPKMWVVVLPSFVWTGPHSFVKQEDGTWDDPDTEKHLWGAYRAGALALLGGRDNRNWSWWLW